MPKATPLTISGKVTAKSPYGIKMDDGEEWINFSKPEYREEPWEWDDVQKGDWVEIKRSGNFFKSIVLIEPPTGEGMVRGPEEGYRAELGEGDPFEGVETGKPDGQFRSPLDFRRTSALAQAVARHVNAPAHSDEDVILTAIRFEGYLAKGE